MATAMITAYKGVSTDGGAYRSRICLNGKSVYLGNFATPELAHVAYRQAMAKYRLDARVFLHKRFMDKVKISLGCWEWQAAKLRRGYGQFGSGQGKRLILAHRMAWTLFVGKIPDGLCVLHKCDNPPCVNPNHLFLGTYKDNAEDMVAKNRHWKGRDERDKS
jgi:hypothetical protein